MIISTLAAFYFFKKLDFAFFPHVELMVALSLKVKNHPGGNLVSNYKPVTKTKMLVLVFAVGLVCLKSPFEGMLNFAELFEMKGGCAFFRVLTGCILLARRFGF